MAPPLRIAVAGASGFIGQALVAHAVGAGHEVTAISRLGNSVPGARDVRLSGYTSVGEFAQGLRNSDVLVHLAARAHQSNNSTDADFSVNLAVTKAVVHAARDAGVGRLIFISSIGVNGDHTDGHAFTESDRPAPTEPYARSKLLCERWLEEELSVRGGPDWTTIRPPLVYGRGAPGNFARLARAIKTRIPLPLAGVKNLRSLVGLDNLLDMVMTCAHHARASNQLFLVADGEDISTPDLLLSTGSAMGTPARLWPVPHPLLSVIATATGRRDQLARLSGSLQVDIAKARSVLGWSPPLSLTEGLRRAVAPVEGR